MNCLSNKNNKVALAYLHNFKKFRGLIYSLYERNVKLNQNELSNKNNHALLYLDNVKAIIELIYRLYVRKHRNALFIKQE